MYKICPVCDKPKLPRSFRGKNVICIGCAIRLNGPRKNDYLLKMANNIIKRNIGVVQWFDNKKGYGFINTNYGTIFVHYSSICTNKYKTLKEGQTVEFDIDKKDNSNGKKQAINVKVI